MPIIFLAVLIIIIVMIVKHLHAALIIGGSLIALGVLAALVRRILVPPGSRPAKNVAKVRAAREDDLEWWKSDRTGPS